MSKVIDYLNANQQRAREELFELLRIPSISTQQEHSPDMLRASQWLCSRLEEIPLAAEIIRTEFSYDKKCESGPYPNVR